MVNVTNNSETPNKIWGSMRTRDILSLSRALIAHLKVRGVFLETGNLVLSPTVSLYADCRSGPRNASESAVLYFVSLSMHY
jgi:hypothetical protein